MSSIDFTSFLKLMAHEKASDLFITAGVPPSMKVQGKVSPITQDPLTTKQSRDMVLEVMSKFDDSLGLDQRQHEVIVQELLAREPALRTDADSLGRDDANLRRNLVLMVLSAGDARSIRAAVSERQWRTLSQLMNQGRAIRSWIEQQGVLMGKP